jgi:RNA polymerase sigma-70 factor, ECF subfamily
MRRIQRVESAEAETVRRAQQGDAAAFERIYQLHGPRIYALCLRIVRNPTEAEDLTQEAFLRVFRKIHMFWGESAFSTWLYRLALNVVLMKLRKNRLPEASLEETTRSNEESTGQSKELGGLDSRLTGLIDRLNLERAVEQLPSAFKTVFVLHDHYCPVVGFSYRRNWLYYSGLSDISTFFDLKCKRPFLALRPGLILRNNGLWIPDELFSRS